MTIYASFTFKLRSWIRLGTKFWMKGAKRHNEKQDWKQISTQKKGKSQQKNQWKCNFGVP